MFCAWQYCPLCFSSDSMLCVWVLKRMSWLTMSLTAFWQRCVCILSMDGRSVLVISLQFWSFSGEPSLPGWYCHPRQWYSWWACSPPVLCGCEGTAADQDLHEQCNEGVSSPSSPWLLCWQSSLDFKLREGRWACCFSPHDDEGLHRGRGYLSEVHYYYFPRLVYTKDEIIFLPLDKDVVHHCPVSHLVPTLNEAWDGCLISEFDDLSIRKSRIQLQVAVGRPRLVSFSIIFPRQTVLSSEQYSRKSIIHWSVPMKGKL